MNFIFILKNFCARNPFVSESLRGCVRWNNFEHPGTHLGGHWSVEHTWCWTLPLRLKMITVVIRKRKRNVVIRECSHVTTVVMREGGEREL